MPAFINKILGLKSVIGRRLIIYILLFSLVITFIGTSLQLYLDYDRNLKSIHNIFEQVESSYLQSITNSLWVTDDELLRIQLEGILRLPNMQFIEIRKGAKVLQAVGSPQSENIIEKTIPLIYAYNGRDVHLGELHVVASLKGVYARIFDRVMVILRIQTITIFLVSLFIIIIFYQLVGRHIISLASFTKSMHFETMDQQLTLDRKPKTKKPDELDQLVISFNQMRKNLVLDITKLKHAEETLQKSNSLLSSILESPDNIIMFAMDTNYNYLSFNKAHAREMKAIYDIDIELGKNISSFISNEEDLSKAHINYKRVLNGERFIEIQEYGEADNRFWYELIFNPILDAFHHVTGFTVFVSNITEQKKLNKELTKHREHLEKLVAEKTLDLRKTVSLMAGREIRMAELKEIIKKLRVQLQENKLNPIVDDPLVNDEFIDAGNLAMEIDNDQKK